MYRITYALVLHVCCMCFTLSASDEVKKGGSVRLPKRSIVDSFGLVHSVSHDRLQEALLDEAARVKPDKDADLEDAFGSNTGSSTAESSRAEPLSKRQQTDHSVDLGDYSVDLSVNAEWKKSALDPRTTATLKKIAVMNDEQRKELTRDIKDLEPGMKKMYARRRSLPSEERDKRITECLSKTLAVVHKVPENTVEYLSFGQEIVAIRQEKQSQSNCCVIL